MQDVLQQYASPPIETVFFFATIRDNAKKKTEVMKNAVQYYLYIHKGTAYTPPRQKHACQIMQTPPTRRQHGATTNHTSTHQECLFPEKPRP